MSPARRASLDDRFDPAVRIVAYDPAWPERASAELARIGAVLGLAALRLEHVGSTAVPGLAAKPIVDLQVSVAAAEAPEEHVAALGTLGYAFFRASESPDYHFFGKPPERPRAYHLHLCAAGSRHELRHLAVRDFLRAHDEERERYAALKRELAARHPRDRLAYIAGKEEYVAALEARALMWPR